MVRTHKYLESKYKPEEHKFKGWHWDHVTKAFYKWNDLMDIMREHEQTDKGL